MGGDSFPNPMDLNSPRPGWQRIAIEDLCDKVAGGATPLRSRLEFYDGGTISWFKTGELRDGWLDHAKERVTPLAIEQTATRIFPPNTVLMAMYGDGKTITSLGILRTSAASNQACCAMIANPKRCDFRFLFYALKYHREDFIRLATGGAQRNLSTMLIRRFRIDIPNDLEQQRAIANVLGTLDDKIELNRKTNETLESMARALFKSWFVDFDPVHAKAAGHAPFGMDAATAKLFPSEFVDSELGPIPNGWSVSSIGDLADIVGGSTPSTKEPRFWEQGSHFWVTPKDLSLLENVVVSRTERLITDAGLAQIGSGLLPVGTVLLSSRAPIGYLGIAEVPLAVNQGFIAMKPLPGVSNHFLLRWAEWASAEIVSRANGSTFLEISKSNFRPIRLVTPPAQVMAAFHTAVDGLHRRLASNARESDTLSSLRDALLPRLLSGELQLGGMR